MAADPVEVPDADILLVSTPVWLGHPSSVTQWILERLDAELSNSDNAGRPAMAGKVAIVSVVGNEAGAHKVVADVFQALNVSATASPRRDAGIGNGIES